MMLRVCDPWGCECVVFHWLTSFGGQTWGTKLLMKISEVTNYTLEDDPMVEENTLPGGQDVRVYVSFRECKRPRFFQVIRKVSGSTASADPPLWHRGRPEIETA